MNEDLNKRAMGVLKEKARGLGMTQKRVADELDVSLPTVKRWWAGKGIGLKVLGDLCGLTGTTLSQLFLELEAGGAAYTYTMEQERLFVAHPRTLAFFDLIVSGRKAESIRHQYALGQKEVLSILGKLEKVGLIEVHPNNRVKLKQEGEPQWLINGPLASKYRRQMIEAFLDDHPKKTTTFFIHDYLDEDAAMIKGKIAELERIMKTCNTRGIARSEAAKSYGCYLTLKEFEWSLRKELSR